MVSRIGLLPLWIFLFLISVAVPARGTEIGTAFSYQGRLVKDGTPVTSEVPHCDFIFGLWDQNAPDGMQLANSPQAVNDVAVIDGLFTVSIDFGESALDGTARWLEITVQCPGDAMPTTLLPRQELKPAPHALALPGLYTQQNMTSPNLIGGFSGNVVTTDVVGATIAGGGRSDDGVGMPDNNLVTDIYATIGGGRGNQAGDGMGSASDRRYATVCGGVENTAGGLASTVGGGFTNSASGSYSIVGGGQDNDSSGLSSTIAGGFSNEAGSAYSTIGGGNSNSASNYAATVAGGLNNQATLDVSTVGGGSNNEAAGSASTIAGGGGNTASGGYSTVGGGSANQAGGNHSTVPGGFFNQAGGDYSMAAGGSLNQADGDYSMAAGRRAKILDLHDGTFVWADSTDVDFTSSGPNQFLIRAGGGVAINTSFPMDPLTVNGAIRSMSGGFKFPDGTTQTTRAVGDGHSLDAADGTPVNALFVDNDGGIGVGTTTPANRVDVEGGVAIGASYSGSAGAPANGMIIQGNVGIGTSSPSAALDVVGTTELNGALTVDTTTFFVDATNNRVGIGTLGPINWLDVEGGAVVGAAYAGNNAALANELLVEGSVGIGTTAPGSSLEITGGVRARGGPPGGFGANNNGYAFSGNGGDNDSGLFSTADGQVSLHVNSGEQMKAVLGGVGVGRTPTANRLEVEGTASKTTAGDWLANSDRAIKTQVRMLADALDVILKLRPVAFRNTEEYRAKHPSVKDQDYFNYVAQEFREVFPDSVQDSGEEGLLQMDSYPASVYSIAAIQPLHSIVQETDCEIAELREQLAELRAMVKSLATQNGTVVP